MRNYFDTEFIEDGITIDLISIGIVAQDNREYYAINYDCNWDRASDWVKENVLVHLPEKRLGGVIKNKSVIAREVFKFCDPKQYRTPDFWADYAAYDWVALCQLFGKMMDLPEGFPMYCNDIQQLILDLGQTDVKPPKQYGTQHNALDDARHVKVLYEYYTGLTNVN